MSKTKIIELRQKRAKVIGDARAILDKAEAEKRDLTQEEQNNWDAGMADADKLKTTIDREERMLLQEADLGDPVTVATRPQPEGSQEDRGGQQQRIEFRSRGMVGTDRMDPEWRDDPEWRRLLRTAGGSYRNGFQKFLRGHSVPAEMRSLQADLDSAGGYLMMPIQMVDALLKAVDDQVFVRQFATVYAVPNADSLGVPVLDSDPADSDWTTELASAQEDTSMTLGRRELHPHPASKLLKISMKLIRKVPSAEDLAVSRLSYKAGITQERAFMTGSGAGQPLGLFTAHASGIPTSRDISTGNTTTAVTFDGLTEAKYAVKAQYWGRSRWVGHRDFFKSVAKLKDGNGQYIWEQSTKVNAPDMLLGGPISVSEYAPNTFTTGNYVALWGDLSQYWVADSMLMNMQRLVELFSVTNQVGLILRFDTDGQPVSPGGEAFARVTLA